MSLKVRLIDMVSPDCIGGTGAHRFLTFVRQPTFPPIRALGLSAADQRRATGVFPLESRCSWKRSSPAAIFDASQDFCDAREGPR